jgi:hypothetical protein
MSITHRLFIPPANPFDRSFTRRAHRSRSHTLTPHPTTHTQATRIFDSYLGPEAPKRIELPPGMLAFVQEEVGSGAPNINVFGAAHAWVYRRLKQTWYPAFLLSSTYQSLLEHLKKASRHTGGGHVISQTPTSAPLITTPHSTPH